jgi:hypothetical protein
VIRISRPLIASFLLLACSGGGTEPIAPPLLSLQGVVQDSVGAKPVAGVAVQVGSATATTDFLGAYQVNGLTAGTYTVTTTPQHFEAYTRAVPVAANTIHNIPLRRLFPLLTAFTGTASSSTITATFTDLQGVAGIGGSVRVVGSDGSGAYTNVAFLSTGAWSTLSNNSARAQLNAGRTGIQSATWFVSDSQGNAVTVLCTIDGNCVEQ